MAQEVMSSPSPALELPPPSASPHEAGDEAGDDDFTWTAGKIVLSLFLFFTAGVAEIAGGWLVWQAVRLHKGWYLAVAGTVVLFGYGLIPCAQPMDTFGRVYAVYGGFFILLSFLWGWAVDCDRPDTGDWVGSGIAVAGVCVCFFWPR